MQPSLHCTGCGAELSASAAFCAACGKRIGMPAPSVSRKKGGMPTWAILLLALAIIGAIGAIAQNDLTPNTASSDEDSRAVTLKQWEAGTDVSLQGAARICEKHPDWSTDACKAVEQKKIFIGMTADEARASWGKPSRVNRTIYSTGVHEQWVYDYGEGVEAFVYVKEGRVTAIQD